MDDLTYTAFQGDRLFVSGRPAAVALAVRHAEGRLHGSGVLVFDNRTGRAIDLDLRGSEDEIVHRYSAPSPAPEPQRAPGRPKLGVVPREVTLLPRHWEWLAAQPGGASATLRRLIDSARVSGAQAERARNAAAAADRFMSAMLGNAPGYVEASRALYAGDRHRFQECSEGWPADLRDHARRLAEPVFSTADGA
jgi:uncharacterized protein